MRALLFLWWMLPSVLFAQGFPICGNAVVEYGEYCDDGNTQDDDLCSANCLFGAPAQYVAPAVLTAPAPQLRPLKAFGLSFVSGYMTGGFLPSLGHLYAGESQRAYTSWRIRMVSYSIFAASAGLALHDFLSGPTRDPDFQEGGLFTIDNFCEFGVIGQCRAGVLVLPSLLLATATNFYDMIDAPFAARRANQKGVAPWSGAGWPYDPSSARPRLLQSAQLRPTLLPAQGSGFALQLRF